MTWAKDEALTLDEYQTRLASFEGPLDLLLRLIERSQLAISDVSLVAVTDQFLAYCGRRSGAPAQLIAEFAAVAARLVLLKSRGLLPKPPVAEDESDMEDLAVQLELYRSLKKAASHLADRDAIGREAFAPNGTGARAPDAPTPLLAHYRASVLRHSLRRRLSVVSMPSLIVGTQPVISLRDMVERISRALVEYPSIGFSAILKNYPSRPEKLMAFLAILIMIRRQQTVAEQQARFGEIALRARSTPVPTLGDVPAKVLEVASE